VSQPLYDQICSSDPCASCILSQRVDILSFYRNNGWDISCSNQKNIVDNWCSDAVDPVGCNTVKNGACNNQCSAAPGTTPGVVPTSGPPSSLPPGCQLGTGDCSVANLSKKDAGGFPVYFPDERSAEIASYICQRESASLPNVKNLGCTTGTSVDYSYGYFQINLLAHCPGAFTYTWKPPSCQIINQVKHDECVALLSNPHENIRFAVSLSNNGTVWGPWRLPNDPCVP
jgi:hypothetical protein